MFTQINSGGIRAAEGFQVSVEADVSDGLPGFSISGQLASEVKEAQDRVRTALRNSGFRLPAKKITVNLSPAGIRKGGTAFDLPIAVAILGASGFLETEKLKDSMLIGELGLDGSVKKVSGILTLAASAKKWGFRRCFIPQENKQEGQIIKEMEIIGVKSLEHMADLLNNPQSLEAASKREKTVLPVRGSYGVDFKELNGQRVLRRAAEVAVAGMHGLLMNGSAGTGKTMTAQRIPTILPSLSEEEDIEISKIYSICGLLPEGQPLLSRRPFRSPHHTITPQGLVGGGNFPVPGEVSLASGGVLFLDELPHFPRASIEALRQPLEDRKVTITRLAGTYEFPADFMMVAAMNPCPCGFFPDRNRCNCSETQIRRYLNRISRPILERFDVCAEASPVSFGELEHTSGQNEDSASIRERVEKAAAIQKKRFNGTKIRWNSRMGSKEIKEYCSLGASEKAFAKKVYEIKKLSARGYHKVLKVARTIADLEGEEKIQKEHLAEAFGYRTLEERLWGEKL